MVVFPYLALQLMSGRIQLALTWWFVALLVITDVTSALAPMLWGGYTETSCVWINLVLACIIMAVFQLEVVLRLATTSACRMRLVATPTLLRLMFLAMLPPYPAYIYTHHTWFAHIYTHHKSKTDIVHHITITHSSL